MTLASFSVRKHRHSVSTKLLTIVLSGWEGERRGLILDSGCVSPTCSVVVGLSIEGVLSENNLVSDDGKAVNVSFLRGALFPQVLRSCPQVCQEDKEKEV